MTPGKVFGCSELQKVLIFEMSAFNEFEPHLNLPKLSGDSNSLNSASAIAKSIFYSIVCLFVCVKILFCIQRENVHNI